MQEKEYPPSGKDGGGIERRGEGPDTDMSSLPGEVDLEKRSEDRAGEDGRRSGPESMSSGEGEDGRDGGDGDGGVMSRVVSRVLSRVSTKSSWNPGPPPDGGVKAWTAGERFLNRLKYLHLAACE